LLSCLALLTVTLRLWQFDPRVPLAYHDDATGHLMVIKAVLDHGGHTRNDNLGAPFGLEMCDFPTADGLHVAVIRLLSVLTGDVALLFNVFYLMTFPLTALTALFALRRLGLPRLVAGAAALLYAFLPYHFLRLMVPTAGHLFLSAYYLVPLVCVICVRLALGRLPFVRAYEVPGRRWHLTSLETAGTAAVCLLAGNAGIYYAFFSCFLLLVAGLAGSAARRSAAPALVAAALVGLVSASTLASLAPTLLYRLAAGNNPEAEDSRRAPGEAEHLGLKVAQLVLPVTDHRVSLLARVKRRYSAPPTPLVNENDMATLGLLGSVGFLYLVLRFFLRPSRPSRLKMCDALALLNLAAVFLGVVGGFGSLVALTVTPKIRCYNRISVFVAFFALAALAYLLCKAQRRLSATPTARAAFTLAVAAAVLAGTFDQTTRAFVPPYTALAARYQEDAAAAARVEATLPPGSAVYQLPYFRFLMPQRPLHRHLKYDGFKLYLHSHALRWSYGTMIGRYGELWHARLADLPLPRQLEELVAAGFAAALLDRHAYADGGAALESQLEALLGGPPAWVSGERYVFFDLTAYAATLRRRYTDEQWAARREAALRPVVVRWRSGLSLPDDTAPEGRQPRWCSRRGQVVVCNPRDVPVRVTLRMELLPGAGRPGRLEVSGGLLGEALEVGPPSVSVERGVTVSPGNHVVSFAWDGPFLTPSGEGQERAFGVLHFRCEED
jgi:phosphoglycerol transferase